MLFDKTLINTGIIKGLFLKSESGTRKEVVYYNSYNRTVSRIKQKKL